MPFGFLVLKPSGVRFAAEVSFRNYLVNWGYMTRIWITVALLQLSGLCSISGLVASRA